MYSYFLYGYTLYKMYEYSGMVARAINIPRRLYAYSGVITTIPKFTYNFYSWLTYKPCLTEDEYSIDWVVIDIKGNRSRVENI